MKKLFLIFTLLATLVIPAAPAVVGYADNPLSGACSKLTPAQQKDSAACSVDQNNNPLSGSNGVINKLAKGVALVGGAIAVIIIIVSGIAMITSSGDSQSFKNARNGVIYAAVGLAIIAIAEGLVALVLNGV